MMARARGRWEYRRMFVGNARMMARARGRCRDDVDGVEYDIMMARARGRCPEAIAFFGALGDDGGRAERFHSINAVQVGTPRKCNSASGL